MRGRPVDGRSTERFQGPRLNPNVSPDRLEKKLTYGF
jgi:hypothetical protein